MLESVSGIAKPLSMMFFFGQKLSSMTPTLSTINCDDWVIVCRAPRHRGTSGSIRSKQPVTLSSRKTSSKPPPASAAFPMIALMVSSQSPQRSRPRVRALLTRLPSSSSRFMGFIPRLTSSMTSTTRISQPCSKTSTTPEMRKTRLAGTWRMHTTILTRPTQQLKQRRPARTR